MTDWEFSNGKTALMKIRAVTRVIVIVKLTRYKGYKLQRKCTKSPAPK